MSTTSSVRRGYELSLALRESKVGVVAAPFVHPPHAYRDVVIAIATDGVIFFTSPLRRDRAIDHEGTVELHHVICTGLHIVDAAVSSIGEYIALLSSAGKVIICEQQALHMWKMREANIAPHTIMKFDRWNCENELLMQRKDGAIMRLVRRKPLLKHPYWIVCS